MITQQKTYEPGETATFFCLSAAPKPTDCGNGSVLIEMDTKHVFLFDEEHKIWYQYI